MKGDFSHWNFDPRDNHAGVLQQQGRVLLDRDWNAQVRIATHRADETARDGIGARVAAVPSDQADGFRVVQVAVGTGPDGTERIELTLTPGRLWADGIPVALAGEDGADPDTLLRVADYLRPPVQSPAASIGSLAAGDRDAVILEVTREALNAFQLPELLIEPALGGPDTTERMHTRAAFRLYRLGAHEDCRTILPGLADDPARRGRLTVQLQPTVVVPGDCPVVAGGGYTGFEHHLYRIEIARLADGDPPHFKWSQFNGGLVGRGRLETTPDRILITANRPAIVNSGLSSFYAEIVQWDAERGSWDVTLGAEVTLSDGELHVSQVLFGSFSATTQTVFFRLWNGLRPVLNEFDDPASPGELLDGIQLAFPPAAIANLQAGDYWTFEVRAGEITNAEILIDDAPPAGPRYHRVALAEVTWGSPEDPVVPPQLHDCRRRFRPLTNQQVCCTLLVGDGVRSFGDFNCLAEAAAHLPPGGGDLCLLPGIHFANATLTDRRNVRIHGCRDRTWVFPRPDEPDRPIVTFQGGRNLSIEDVQFVSFQGMCVRVEASEGGAPREVLIHRTRMMGRTHALRVDAALDLRLTDNILHVWDTEQGGAVVSLLAEDVLIAHNRIIVRPGEAVPQDDEGDDERTGDHPTPEDSCTTLEDLYGQLAAAPHYIAVIWLAAAFGPPQQPYRAQGGLHLRGGSATLRVRYNRIAGGASHGITLGGTLRGDPAVVIDDADESGNGAVPRITIGDETEFAVRTVNAGNGAPVARVPIFLTEGPASFARQTDDQGYLISKHQPGIYRVSTGAAYTIQEVDAGNVAGLPAPLYTLRLGPADPAAAAAAAFIRDLNIDNNEISRMGLAGIGFTLLAGTEAAPAGTAILSAAAQTDAIDDPATVAAVILATLLSPHELVGTTNPVRGLHITRNRIFGNVLNPFSEAMRAASKRVALGGISLGIVEEVSLAENDVRENGPNAIDPVCGIFIAHGDDLDICNNTLSENGIVVDPGDYLDRRAQGLRSGLFVRFAGATAIARGSRKPALRVQDNRIDQPAGRAITVLAFGPVTCDGNFLNSERTGNWSFYDEAVGGVLILNLGGLHRALNAPAQEIPIGSGPPDNVPGKPNKNLGIAAGDFRSPSVAESALPGGEVLYNNNQVRLGATHTAYTAQLVASLDDLGYDANQSSLFGQSLLFANTVLAARTLRATGCRFTEDLSAEVQQGTISLLSYGFSANTTAHNQADHCIVALPHAGSDELPTISAPNQVLNAWFCGRFAELIGILTYGIGFLFMVRARDAQNLTESEIVEEAAGVGGLALDGGNEALIQVYGANAEVLRAYQYEEVYLTQHYGAGDARVVELRQRVLQQRKTLDALQVEQELAGIALSRTARPVDPDLSPATDGRVTAPGVGGKQKLRVEYVDRQGRPLGPATTTDASGYYTFQLSQEEVAELTGREDVFVRVLDPSGNEISRSSTPIAPTRPQRINFEVAGTTVASGPVDAGEPIFTRPEPPPQPQPPPPPGPAPQPRPTTSTPLENIRGIGTARAEELRRRGIADVETLVRAPSELLAGIAGFDAEAAKEEGRRILEQRPPTDAPNRPGGPDDPRR